MKRINKLVLLVLAVVMVFSVAACDGDTGSDVAQELTKENLKIGVVHIGEVGDRGYTFNHDRGIREAMAAIGLTDANYIPKFNIPPGADAVAAIRELVNEGCQIIFATSFGHGPMMAEAAAEFPDVTFAHATGTGAHSANLDNFHNYFARVYEVRYLAGIAAGLRTETNKLGYVAAHPFAEVISGYTAFFLGARSVNPDVTMDVIYINSWGDPDLERTVAQRLIEMGNDVIGQHSDSITPSQAAEEAGVWSVGYNTDMAEVAPGAAIISPRINWAIYYTLAIQSLLDGTPLPLDWGGGIEENAVVLSPLNTAIAAPGTQEAIDKAKADLIAGMLVFSGALVDNDGNPAQITDFDGNVIYTFTDENSAFFESRKTSAPSFNAIIQGISIIS